MGITSVTRVPYASAGFGDQLTHDLAHGVPSAASFFPIRHWSDVVRQLNARKHPREKLASILHASATAQNAPAEALANIRRLAEPHTYVIATGQQAGLLGGPLYSLHKALTTIKLARQYTAESNGAAQFVPVFWVASDDHDLGEIDHADFLDATGSLSRVRADPGAAATGCSACDVRMDDAGLNELRGQLEKMSDSNMAAFLEAYRGCSLGDAFAKLLSQWLGVLGLVVVQSSDLRPLAAELLERDLADFDTVSRLIQEEALRMTQCGYKPGFSRTASAPHFFIRSEPSRVRARLDPQPGGLFQERSSAFAAHTQAPRVFTRDALQEMIHARPELFSASAALRPVLQQRIFPVAAAVLGPGEIAYWAQLKAVHDHFDTVWPLVVPRATLTLIDTRGGKLLRKLNMQPGAGLFKDFHALQQGLAGAGASSEKIGQRAARVLAEVDALAAEVRSANGGLNPLLEKARARIEHELRHVAEKFQLALSEKEGVGRDRLRYLSTLVRPKNSPQERVLCCAQFLARYPGLPAELLSIIDPAVREHYVVSVE
jgi:bacillithiol biosynthesis cysteine-adding enzyme BshC